MKLPPIPKKYANSPRRHPELITQKDTETKKIIDAFMSKHKETCNSGWVTVAWYGLQWSNCGDYINVKCSGCGDSLVQYGRNSELVEITQT